MAGHMCGRGVHGGGMHSGGHAWQGACVAGRMCGRGGMHGRGMHGRGACVAGGHVWQLGHAWQERWPLQQTVSILLECILVK